MKRGVLNTGLDTAAISVALLVSGLLALLSVAFGLAWIPVSHETRVVFDVASEANVWTWFNVVLLITGAYTHCWAAYMRWRVRLRYYLPWLMTALVLAGLSLDDLAAMHEKLDGVGRALGGGEGFTHFAWVIPGAFIGAAVVVGFVVIASQLAWRPRMLLMFGVVCLVGAAVGVEAASAFILSQQGYAALYVGIYHVEEMLEAVGASLLMGAGLADLPASSRSLGVYAARAAAGGRKRLRAGSPSMASSGSLCGVLSTWSSRRSPLVRLHALPQSDATAPPFRTASSRQVLPAAS